MSVSENISVLLSKYNNDGILSDNDISSLEQFIIQCNKAMVEGDCIPLVPDAMYDSMTDVLKQLKPESEVLEKLWSDYSDDNSVDIENGLNDLLIRYPMMSICTCKSFECEEFETFVSRLPESEINIHVSCKENGHGVRLVYCNGVHTYSTSRMRSSGGHVITNQLNTILAKDTDLRVLDCFVDEPLVEIRGELLLPFSNFETANQYRKIVSAFTGVSSMLRDSASEEEWSLLEFVAYKVVSDNYQFATKSDEYAFLESLGFKTPKNWLFSGVSKYNAYELLPQILEYCADEVQPDENGDNGYEYYTDGIVVEVDDRDIFKSMGSDGKKYNNGNVALKIGYWKQDMYTGYVQTIMWTAGKGKYNPVAIVAEEPDIIQYKDYSSYKPYIRSEKEISNYSDLGVSTAAGNKVRCVPLYEAANMVALGVQVGGVLNFKYGGEAGVVPCFIDGTLLSDKGKKVASRLDSYEAPDDGDDVFDLEYVVVD